MDFTIKKIDEWRFLIPKTGAMRVPGLIFSSSQLMPNIKDDQSLQQVVNVATLPGIVKHSLAMPDIHWGYGFPIGGVAAFNMEEGIISPGGVGYDINCGVRLLTTALVAHEIRPQIKELVSALFKNIPTGVGSRGRIRLSKKEERKVAVEGASWAIGRGMGEKEDLERTEDYGVMKGADPVIIFWRYR
jgi:tRNA-splicing ligase RtcB